MIRVVSFILCLKRFFYFEAIISIGKRFSFGLYFLPKYFKSHSFVFKKVFLIFLCLKLLIDPFSTSSVKAQEDNFNLIQLQSPPVSFGVTLPPTAITLGSLPVSYSLSRSLDFIKLSSIPVSFNTSILPTSITLSSNKVSYSVTRTTDLIKLSSLPVSYSLNIFGGELFKIDSKNVS